EAVTADDPFNEFTATLSEEQKAQVAEKPYFYEVSLENKGGLVMPVILEFTYKDGSQEIKRIPAEIWRRNAEQIAKVFNTEKEVTSIVLDPFEETADVDLSNNYWPKQELPSRFQLYKEKASDGNK
ncbi:MAG: M1 family peptidase, partial [Bacteroidota bacterium]